MKPLCFRQIHLDFHTSVMTNNAVRRILALILVFSCCIMPCQAQQTDEIVAYPNPFSFENTISGGIRFVNVPIGGTVKIYSMRGELVIEIGPVFLGSALWDGCNRARDHVAPGVYYWLVYLAKDVVATGKLSVIR
jgi:hypothetical protein